MTKRYFKATNGEYTIFRASESRTYRYGWINLSQRTRRSADGKTWEKYGEVIPLDLGFTNPTTVPKSATTGPLPAVEIGKGEYMALVAIKTARINAWAEERRAQGQTVFGGTAPGDSWVRNDELPEALYVGPTA